MTWTEQSGTGVKWAEEWNDILLLSDGTPFELSTGEYLEVTTHADYLDVSADDTLWTGSNATKPLWNGQVATNPTWS